MKFVKSYGRFNLNESKDKIINIETEFQSVLDLLDGFRFKLGKSSIEIFMNGKDVMTDNVDDFRKSIEHQRKSVEILEDCLHVVERLRDDSIDISLSFIDDVIKINLMGKGTNVILRDIFDIEYDPDENDRPQIVLDQNNLFTYFKSRYDINVKKVTTDYDYNDDELTYNKILISYSGDMTEEKLSDFRSDFENMDSNNNEILGESMSDYVQSFTLYPHPGHSFIEIVLLGETMID